MMTGKSIYSIGDIVIYNIYNLLFIYISIIVIVIYNVLANIYNRTVLYSVSPFRVTRQHCTCLLPSRAQGQQTCTVLPCTVLPFTLGLGHPPHCCSSDTAFTVGGAIRREYYSALPPPPHGTAAAAAATASAASTLGGSGSKLPPPPPRPQPGQERPTEHPSPPAACEAAAAAGCWLPGTGATCVPGVTGSCTSSKSLHPLTHGGRRG